MSDPQLHECSFLIPLRRDANLCDGEVHSTATWDWLMNEMFLQFAGGTQAPGFYQGFYQDPDTLEQVTDESRRFIVAVAEEQLNNLRGLLSAACVLFQQKCIYLSISGMVEFIKAPDHG